MKKLFLVLALMTHGTVFLMAFQTAPAQAGTAQERAKKGADYMSKELGLNDDQKAKWEAAALERITANAPAFEKLKGSTTPQERKSMRAAIKSNQERFDATVTAFLTAEQKTKYNAVKESIKKKMIERVKHRKSQEGADLDF